MFYKICVYICIQTNIYMIYLIDFESCYKIGRTFDLKNRMRQFCTARENAECLEVILYPEITLDLKSKDEEMEKELHVRCKKFHITKELFTKSPEVLDIFLKYKEEVGDLDRHKEEIDNFLSKKNPVILNKLSIYQYSLEGKLLKEFPSRAEAERTNNIRRGSIKEVLNGRQRMVGGYFWSDHLLSEDEISEKVESIKNRRIGEIYLGKVLNQYSPTGEFIKTWESMTTAGNKLGIAISSISLCCKGKYKKAGGYIWRME